MFDRASAPMLVFGKVRNFRCSEAVIGERRFRVESVNSPATGPVVLAGGVRAAHIDCYKPEGVDMTIRGHLKYRYRLMIWGVIMTPVLGLSWLHSSTPLNHSFRR